MKVFIGSDPREPDAVRVAWQSLHRCSGIEAELLVAEKLRDAGLLWRITDYRNGQSYDLVSNAPKSTSFAASRFLVPLLCQGGYALFADADVVFLRDPREMLKEIEPGKAVYVVKHEHKEAPATKMGGLVNQAYEKKLWSSVMLFHVDHPANRRLTLWDVNHRRGIWLHQFGWLHESEIGSLDPSWNVLIGIDEISPSASLLHYTLGGPFIPGWKGGPHDDIWLRAASIEGAGTGTAPAAALTL